jgi:hypothetical protein
VPASSAAPASTPAPATQPSGDDGSHRTHSDNGRHLGDSGSHDG